MAAKSKVYTVSKDKYEYIRKKTDGKYNNTIVFHIAAALGIKHGKKKELRGKRTDLINVPEVDKDKYLRSLLMAKREDLFGKDYGDEEFLTELEKYAEYGVEAIYQDLVKFGTVKISKYAKS